MYLTRRQKFRIFLQKNNWKIETLKSWTLTLSFTFSFFIFAVASQQGLVSSFASSKNTKEKSPTFQLHSDNLTEPSWFVVFNARKKAWEVKDHKKNILFTLKGVTWIQSKKAKERQVFKYKPEIGKNLRSIASEQSQSQSNPTIILSSLPHHLLKHQSSPLDKLISVELSRIDDQLHLSAQKMLEDKRGKVYKIHHQTYKAYNPLFANNQQTVKIILN